MLIQLDALQDSVLRIDRQGVLISCLPAAGASVSSALQPLIGKPIDSFLTSPTAAAISQQLAILRLGQGYGRIQLSELIGERDTRFECLLIPDTDATVLLVSHQLPHVDQRTSQGDELDELQTVNVQLARSEARTRAIIEGMTDGLAVADKRGYLELFNRRATEILGIGMTDEDADHWASIYGLYLPDGITPCPTDQLPLIRATAGEVVEDFELILRKRKPESSRPIPISVRAAPILDEAGNLEGAVAIFADISDQKRAEELLAKQQNELAHITRQHTMGEMATSLAHELNQPLNAIVNYARGIARRVAQTESLDDQFDDAVQEIVRESLRASSIIQGLRRLATKREPAVKLLDVNEVLHKAISLCKIQARAKSIVLVSELQPDLPSVRGDAVQIEQVAICLLLNAMDACVSDASPVPRTARHDDYRSSLADSLPIQLPIAADNIEHQVKIMSRIGDDAYIEIYVTDTGQGVQPEHREFLFEPYYSTKTDGMGMGLAVSRSIIESHGGGISYEPRPAGGSIFRFTLPVAHQRRL